ncbi:hypothetical protein AHiyo1_48530 [Arthrobacter sp. Hiyo1]|nr:hypothetical protein AHiyo1_48530 [Arthrobacter sp. Hiyo1]
MERSACQGTTASIPSSVAVSTASSSRSPFARAWTNTSRTAGWCSSWTAEATTVRVPCPDSATVPVSRLPAPSAISTASPISRRLTVTACLASAPSSMKESPGPSPSSDPAAVKNTGLLTATGYRACPAASRTYLHWPQACLR